MNGSQDLLTLLGPWAMVSLLALLGPKLAAWLAACLLSCWLPGCLAACLPGCVWLPLWLAVSAWLPALKEGHPLLAQVIGLAGLPGLPPRVGKG